MSVVVGTGLSEIVVVGKKSESGSCPFRRGLGGSCACIRIQSLMLKH
jgi:hypothetical protein